MNKQSIPVLYYHRVGAPDPVHLSITQEQFDRQMSYLKSSGFTTVTVRELIDYLAGQAGVPRKSVCITFDDGFIDNLKFAHPILKKHGQKAAIFVATSLIRPENQPAAVKMVNFNSAHTLARRGDLGHFLSLAELKEMQESGIWEVYSHSHHHNQVFTSTEITGIYPDSDDHWGILSAYRKDLGDGKWPVYSRGPGLVNKAWRAGDNRETRENLVQETDEEFVSRVENDLKTSLDIIKESFPDNYPVICWPWGKADEKLEELAKKVGYRAAFRTDTGPNVPGMNLMRIHRFPVKKPDLLRFKLGIKLRMNPLLARIYSFVRK
ncbi:MAG: polysaccharide deacetylase family protein [Candidatus Rifleibacteriota bacterium]